MKRFETFNDFATEFGVMDTPIMRRIYGVMKEREEDVLVTRIRELVEEGIEDYDFNELFEGLIEDYDFDLSDEIEEAIENSYKVDDMESEISDLQDDVEEMKGDTRELERRIEELESERIEGDSEEIEVLIDRIEELEDYVRNLQILNGKIMNLINATFSSDLLEKFDL